LLEKGEWEKLAETRIKEVEEKYTQTLGLTQKQLDKIQKEREEFAQKAAQTETELKNVLRDTKLEKELKKLDFTGDLDYFIYKYGSQISIENRELKTVSGEPIGKFLEALKKDESNKQFWAGIQISGSGSTPGVTESTAPRTSPKPGPIVVPAAAKRNPAIYAEYGIDPKKVMSMVATGKLKYEG
jgi:hypothetical protein